MRKFYVGVFVFFAFFWSEVKGQYSISGTGAANTYTQNFDAYQGTLSTIPTNWIWSWNDFTPGGFYDRTGTYNNSNSSYALRESGAPGTDIAFGTKNDGAQTLTFGVINNTGLTLGGFEISWNVEQYSASTNATPVSFSYRLNSEPFGLVSASGTGTSPITASPSATAGNLSSIISTSRSISIAGISLLNGEFAEFRITIGNSTGNNAHIGVDDFTVYAIAATPRPRNKSPGQRSKYCRWSYRHFNN